MRLKVSRSQNSETLYMIRSTYLDGKNSSEIVERLGTPAEISKKHPGRDPYEWAREYIAKKTAEEKARRHKLVETYNPARRLVKNDRQLFFGGYLFVLLLAGELDLGGACARVAARHNLRNNLGDVLSYLVCLHLFQPGLPEPSLEFNRSFIEPLGIQAQQFKQVLEVLERESGTILAELLKNSEDVPKDRQETLDSLIHTLSMVLMRMLEKRLRERFPAAQILEGLNSLYFLKGKSGDYIPVYTRSDFTDALHEAFGFNTDYEIIEYHDMQRIIRKAKKQPGK